MTALFVFFGLVMAAASTGAIFNPGEWYARLAKPRWTPPDWLFPVAWTLLYGMIAISGWLIWRQTGFADGGALALGAWGLHLVFNAAWSVIFFGMHRLGLALLDLIVMLATLVATIILFEPISMLAAVLLIPYLFWVLFAGILNVAILAMNRAPA